MLFFFFSLGILAFFLQVHFYKEKQQLLAGKSYSVFAIVEDKKTQPTEFYKQVIRLRILENIHNNKIKTPFCIACYIRTPITAIPGDIIAIEKLAIPKLKQKNSFLDYLIKENIIGTIFCKKLYYEKITQKPENIEQWLLNKRYYFFQNLQVKLGKIFPLFATLFLGNKTLIKKGKQRILFQRWGISHHLARSGLHITLFIYIWFAILSLIPCPLTIKHILLLLICITYAALSWSSISFVRALSVFFLYEFGILQKKTSNLLYLLLLIAMTTLIFSPIQLFFLDFQLSFSITLALMWSHQRYHRNQKAKSIALKSKTPLS